MGGNLDGIRVLDLTGEPGFFAGRLLGDLGADVVKVEPPGGDPARRRGPFWGGIEDPERALLWLALNVSKRGITLDHTSPPGRELLGRLAARADVLIESDQPGALASHGLGWDALHALNPRLILCSITPFGQSGPRARWRGSDLTVTAMGGNLWGTGDDDRPPVRCALPVAYYHGGLEAAAGIAFALLAREQTGLGQHVDVSLQATMVMPNIGTVSMYKMTGNRGQRVGAFIRQTKSIQREIWPCRDGWVSFALRGGPARIPGLVAMVAYMDECGMASPKLKAMDWKAYNHNLLTQAEVDELSAEFGGFFATKTMAELYRVAAERNLMLAPINTAREIVTSEQLAARGFLTEVEYPGRGTLRYPGHFAITTSRNPESTRIAIRRPAPRLGEHTAEVLAEVGVGNGTPTRVAARPTRMMELFAGTTILEFGGGAAGPVMTRYFADHGATVIRVESRQRPDFLRILKLTPDTKGGIDGSEHFAVLNVNKLSVALNLSKPEAVDVARRLALWADVVAENFAPGAMARWGLDYASLVKSRPDLVMISTCLNGQTGPHRFYPGFGGQGSALSGFNHLTGWPDRAPVGPFGTITDSLSPRYGALLLASALLHRRRTGEGQHVDLSQVEGGIACLSEMIVTYGANGEILGRRGNRSPHVAPHGVFPCTDEDGRERWIAIVCADDAAWQALVACMGTPPWAKDSALATVAGRLASVDLLETCLAEWTRGERRDALAERLQAAGVEAGPVEDFADLHDDPQLTHRRHFRPVEHALLGRHPAETHGIRFSDMDPELRRGAPKLGADTEQVLCTLLGISRDEFGRLRDTDCLV